MRKTELMIALIGAIIIPLTLFSGILPVPKSHRIMAIITTEDLVPAADSFELWHNALGKPRMFIPRIIFIVIISGGINRRK